MAKYHGSNHLSLVMWLLLSHMFPFNCVSSTCFQFSNQKKAPLEKLSNYAILASDGLVPRDTFTICGSIYIGFYRTYQSFYTVRQNDHESLWFSLSIISQDTYKEVYLPVVFYFGGSIHSNTGETLRLRPHAWSHACSTIDMQSGQVLVVINGVLTHNMTIPENHFTSKVPTVFRNNLVLGVMHWKFYGAPDFIQQSEASVTDVNIYSVPIKVTHMVNITTAGQFADGDVVSWSGAKWTLSGSAKDLKSQTICTPTIFPQIYQMGDGFHSWS